ncbi:MAG: PAS domain S-box protein [Euryarchaeota archaeon]|nr:PAS domain S-box protein [Euryarchaeota archaeon]
MVRPPVRLLLIEDNPGDARLLENYLSEVDPPYRLTWRRRLDEGLDLLHKEEPDLVLLDMTLPDSTGVKTVERLRAEHPDLPVIILSGIEDPRLAVEAMRAGAADYLFKGALDRQLVTRSIQYVLERARTESELRRTNALLAATLEATADGVLVFDKEGHVEGHNRQFVELWGLPEALLESGDQDRIRELLLAPLSEPETFRKRTSETSKGHVVSVDTIRFKDGRIFECYINPHKVDDKVLGQVWSFRDVTGERAARAALEAEKERFRGLMESAPDALVIVDHGGKIVLVNQQTEKLFGYSREELIGTEIEILVPPRYAKRHPRHREEYVADPKPRAMGLGLDLAALRKDGSEFPVEIALSPIQTDQGLLIASAIRDVSERKRIEEEIRRSQQLLQEAQAIAHIGSWEWDIPTNSIAWSEELYSIYGLDQSVPVDFETFMRLIHPDERELVDKVVKDAFVAQHEFSFDHRIVRPSGEVRVLHGRGRVETDDAGNTLRMVGTAQDVTEQKQAEDAIEESHRLMARNEKLAALGTLIAGVAHEINNPLAFVKSNEQVVDTLLERHATEDEELLGLIARIRGLMRTNKGGVERIEAIVRSLRQVARPSSGERKEVDLVEIVRDTLPVLEPVRREQNVELVVEADTRPLVVRVNPTELSQVVLNLVKNALEVSPPGGVVRITMVADGRGRPRVQVEDQGPGVPEDQRAQVFDPFFTTKSNGTGLGLSISAKIVESHGGDIMCESVPGSGARFVLTLPHPEDAPKVEPEADPLPTLPRAAEK